MEDGNEDPVEGYPALTVMGYPPHNREFLEARPNLAARNSGPPRRSTATAPTDDCCHRPIGLPLEAEVVVVAILSIFILGAFGVFIYATFFFDPGPHPPKFQVNSVSVSPSNVLSSHDDDDDDDDATAYARWWKWNISFDVRNPNKNARIFYEQVEASVFYKQVNLSSMAIVPFYQYEHDRRCLEVSMRVTNRHNMTLHGAVNFTMTIEGIVRINRGCIEGDRIKLRVICEDVKVGFSDSTAGTMLGESRECMVHCKKNYYLASSQGVSYLYTY